MENLSREKCVVQRYLVILPTYNEAKTIIKVVEELLGLIQQMDILVVDDSSPDGTAGKVEAHPSFNNHLFLLRRPGRLGFASAYKDGFAWALKKKYDVCLCMDSDLSHDPKDIPRFLHEVEAGADLVIGSRYYDGISVINWPLYRLLISICAGKFTRFLTRLPLTDPTSGFKALRHSAIESLEWGNMKSEGYGFLVELKYFAVQKGFRIKEIPIVFTERQDGQSKFNFRIVLEAVLRIFQLGLMKLFGAGKK